ncbi:MAG TPA: inosine/xanthosine triphosphatase [Candidatus Limnocylindrales bacterium]|jgi:inosine/xanthosine triphosphatase|nr:inosine/xanthosine triphosphatase [Candidatus Limnocylindrales bacterium]
METITIAVGSKRGPKLTAVREALKSIGSFLAPGTEFHVEGVEVPSGVRHTPLSREELMAGARQRAEALQQIARERGPSWKYLVGLEGGLDVVQAEAARYVFLESWAYVTDCSGRGFFGQSGGILVPEPLAQRVVDEGVELSEAIDSFAGGSGIRDGQGAWGVLTRDLITRQEAFRVAVIHAFAPFFNREAYSARARSART